jgi:hypothetical protein
VSDKAPAAAETDDLVFETLWGRVLEGWDDDKPHAAILDYALRSQRLPDLAGRYRALKDDPVKGMRANKRVDALVLAATQMMLSAKTPPYKRPPPFLSLTALVIFLVVMGLLYFSFFERH